MKFRREGCHLLLLLLIQLENEHLILKEQYKQLKLESKNYLN
jgi:hypothetical protein